MRSLELLSLEFTSMVTQSLAPHQALATFLMHAPNLRSLELVLWDYDGMASDPAGFQQSKFLDYNLY